MPESTPFTLPVMTAIDPDAYGINVSDPAMQQFLAALTQQISRQVTQQVTEQITAQVTAQVTSQVTEHVTRALKEEHRAEILKLYEQLQAERRRYFGPSADTAQGRLFDEAEALAQDTTEADDTVAIPGAGTVPREATPVAPKARGKRAPLPVELPRLDIVYDIPEADRLCPCGTPMVQIGEEISEQLDIVPMQVRVLRHIRKRYACPSKDVAPITAPLPAQVLPRTNASSSLLAMLLTTKYVDGLPLYRFERIMQRSGVTVPRQTLARWVIGAARALQPLHNLLRDVALDSPVLHMDETTVQVLKEEGRAATAKSYMWVQVAGPPDKPVVLYDYDPSRSREVPKRLLEGWQGDYLMVDGYAAYNEIGRRDSVTLLACWAHLRRKYIDAQRVKGKGKVGHADHAIELIRHLYAIEKRMRHVSDEERHAARQTQSLPILNALHDWHQRIAPTVVPSTVLGKALAYQQSLWPRLVRYVDRGDLPIDNNRAENAIRPYVVGRKSWLFSDQPSGAHASAVIYSLVETARANDVEPYTWLCRVLRDLPRAQNADDYEALLPWNLNPLKMTTEELKTLNS